MHHRSRAPLQGFEGFADNMLPGLGQHLNRHILRDQVTFDQGAKELILCLGSSRESHFDLLESNFHQQLEELHLLLQAHGHDQRLVPVPQIHAAPNRSLVNVIFLRPIHTLYRRHKILPRILFKILHTSLSFSYIPFLLRSTDLPGSGIFLSAAVRSP